MAITPGLEHTRKAIGWAARDTSGVLSPFNFTRRYSFQTSSIPELEKCLRISNGAGIQERKM